VLFRSVLPDTATGTVIPPPVLPQIIPTPPGVTPQLAAQSSPIELVTAVVEQTALNVVQVVETAAKPVARQSTAPTPLSDASSNPLIRPEPTSTSDTERTADHQRFRQATQPDTTTLVRQGKTPELPEQVTISTTIVDRPREFPRARNAAGAPPAGTVATSASTAGQSIQAPVLTALLAAETGGSSGVAGQTRSAQQIMPVGLPIIGGDASSAESFQLQSNAVTPLAATSVDALAGQQRIASTATATAKTISRIATEHVAVNIAGAVRGGLRQITIQMRPVELGEIDISIKISNDGHVRAMVLAERPETLEMLQRDARGLERALQDAGLKTESGGLSFGLRGDGRGGATPEQQQPIVPNYASPTEEPEVDLAAAYTRSFADGGRLDIRV